MVPYLALFPALSNCLPEFSIGLKVNNWVEVKQIGVGRGFYFVRNVFSFFSTVESTLYFPEIN